MLINELKKIVKGEVLADGETLKKYSRDASLFEVKPQVVVFPKDVEDVKELVNYVTLRQTQGASRLSLTPRSAGTDMSGGALGESVVLDFTKYFNRIKEIGYLPVKNWKEVDGYAIVEPGVYYRDFEKEAMKHNLLLPSYPVSKEICAVGGMVGNNSGGEKTLAYGKTEDYVMELKAVLSDGNEYDIKPLTRDQLDKKLGQKDFEGEIYRRIYQLVKGNEEILQNAKPKVSKNSAGYYLWNVWNGKDFDLTKLLVGSQGTLGIITEIKFRLIKPKTHSRLLVIFLKDLKPLVTVAHLVMKYQPESFESFDDHTLKLAIRFLPSLVRILKQNILKLGWQFLPEFWMLLTGGFPKLVLLAEFTGDSDKEIVDRLEKLSKQLADQRIKHRLVKNSKEQKKYWTIRRESFNLLRQHIKGKRTAPFIDDFIVRVEQLSEFLPRLNVILDKYDLIYTIAGHVGDANFHIIPLMDLSDQRSHKIIKELSDKVYNLVLEYGGSITAEHNDGLIRSPYLKKMYGEKVYRLFEETKKIFDPQNIFNPGKKVGADLQYTFRHLIKSLN